MEIRNSKQDTSHGFQRRASGRAAEPGSRVRTRGIVSALTTAVIASIALTGCATNTSAPTPASGAGRSVTSHTAPGAIRTGTASTGTVRAAIDVARSTTAGTPSPNVVTTAAVSTAEHGKGVSPGGVYENTINRMSASGALSVFTDMRSVGVQWVRLDYNYAGSVSAHGGASDQTIQQARKAGLDVTVVLGDGTTTMPESAGFTAKNGWLTSSVKRLASMGVHHFEVGNEVNLGAQWGGKANPTAYVGLLKTVHPIIHAADPSAVVLMAGMAPYGKQAPGSVAQGNNYNPIDFIRQLYKQGGHGSFDAVNLHPYTYPAMPTAADGGYNMLSVLPDLLALMKQQQDASMRIWWTESGMPTGPDGGYPTYTVAQQQQTITQLFQVAAKYPQVGPVFLYDWQDGGVDGDFGLYTSSHQKKASYATFAAVTAK